MEMTGLVGIEITLPLPEEGAVGGTYQIEGVAKVADIIGPPPWVYAEVKKKDWYKPEIIEEVHYFRGLPAPVVGTFRIDWKPSKTGIYEVTVVATPAPLSLPLVGVAPVTGTSEMMGITIGKVGIDVEDFKIVSYG